jgi:methionine synthase I (cobalamin-dependent)
MGPSGKLLLTGAVDAASLRGAFEEQARALAAAGPDAIVIETMSDLEEAGHAIRAARDTGLPVVACMVYDSGKQKDRTMMGKTPEETAKALGELGADAIGANCGSGVAGYVPICRRLAGATDLPIWIKPNAGIPEIVAGQVVYRTTPEEFAAHLDALVDAGAHFIGGCCGTSPAFVAALQTRLEGLCGGRATEGKEG